MTTGGFCGRCTLVKRMQAQLAPSQKTFKFFFLKKNGQGQSNGLEGSRAFYLPVLSGATFAIFLTSGLVGLCWQLFRFRLLWCMNDSLLFFLLSEVMAILQFLFNLTNPEIQIENLDGDMVLMLFKRVLKYPYTIPVARKCAHPLLLASSFCVEPYFECPKNQGRNCTGFVCPCLGSTVSRC